jgi:uncharacterized membrane protein YtjA (UPF0391 family)
MPYHARVFLVVGVMVTILNLVGVSEVPTQFSWILLLIGIVLAAIYGLTGRSARCVSGGIDASRRRRMQ